MDNLFQSIANTNPLTLWLIAFVAGSLIAGIVTGYFQARKIQPNGFKWKFVRREVMWGVFNVAVSGLLLGGLTTWLTTSGLAQFNNEPVAWWVIAIEYAIYFIGFDAYFYWLHRWMHEEPVYSWVHKIHHGSLSPNPLTTFSVSPLESLINGGFVPIFILTATLFALPIHAQTMLLITPTNVLMGLYVHMGFEFLPRWWNKSWATKWFISTTFHDQHHRFFKGNYGGYTTVWDRLCGTMRPTFEADFEKVATRQIKPMWKREAKAEAQSAR